MAAGAVQSGVIQNVPFRTLKDQFGRRSEAAAILIDGNGLINSVITDLWWGMKSDTSSAKNAVLGKAFIRAGEGLSLDDTELSAVLGVQVSTVQCLRHGHELLQPCTEAWSRSLIFVELYQSLLAVAGNEQNAKIWLSSENRGLSCRPRDLITCRTGLEQLVQYLAATRSLI